MPDTGPVDRTLSLLTGDEASRVLSAAVASAGGDLLEWRASQVDHRPGTSTTVAYRTVVRWGDVVQQETLAASTGIGATGDMPAGVLVLGDGEQQVSVWRFPSDPGLPALALACDRRTVGGLLASLGVAGVDVDGSNVHLRVRAYRPRRRAVVEVRAAGGRLFLKVVRPVAVAGLQSRHRLLHGAGVPVPRSLGWTDEGLLVLEALPGTPARQRLRQGASLPPGWALTGLLDALPPEVMDLPCRRSWADRVEHYAGVVASALPAEGDRVNALAAAVGDGLSGAAPEVPTHGDFYESQLLVDGTQVAGLLDVDTVGPGRRADDLACLLAHLHVLAVTSAAESGAVMDAMGAYQRWFEQVVDPVELRLRTAGVLVSLATGPHRVQEAGWPEATRRRLDAAQGWVEEAAVG